ncbi:GntR family transcriptional regulator [Plantibacter flavus]|uniref:GntR family transcriptional regulator n=1 Tax=Plantibacter flavus TaxID=150123 RepID=UPI003F16F7CF
MLFRIDPDSAVSLAEQVAVQVRAGIAAGELAPGERLPPARDLATGLRVNMHTVLRAYAQLRDDGLVGMRQGRGAWVREDAAPGLIRVNELVEELVAEARKVGLSPQELGRMIERSRPS